MLRLWVSILSFTLLSMPAFAAPTKLTYQVYAGGIHVVQADLDLDLKKTTYTARLSAFTRGFLGTLVPWKGSFATEGAGSGVKVTPREHKSISTWKGSDDVAVYTYDARGQFKSLKMTEDGKDKTPKEIDAKLTKDTVDVLTATLRMMQGGACKGESDVFDSRRRFTLKFVPKGTETLAKTRYGFYQGEAVKCTAEVVPKGGAWKKKPRGWLSIQEQGRKKGTLPTLWLAKIDPNLPPVPVRIMVKTDYGTLFMHLASAKVGLKTYAIP